MSCKRDSNLKSEIPVNRKFLPFKIHYFLLCGAHVGVIPYLPVFAKTRLGFSATTVGILSTFMQLSNLLSKPLFGVLADYTKKMRAVLLSLICTEILLVLSILSIPSAPRMNVDQALDHDCNTSHTLHHIADTCVTVQSNSPKMNNLQRKEQLKTLIKNNFTLLSASKSTEKRILAAESEINHQVDCHRNNYAKCKFYCSRTAFRANCFSNLTKCVDLNSIYTMTCKFRRNLKNFNYFNLSYEFKQNSDRTPLDNVIFPRKLTFLGRDPEESFKINCENFSKNCLLQCFYHVDVCYKHNVTTDYNSPSFWMFSAYSILGVMCQGAIFSLSDTICYENLRNSFTNYGRQRFFGALGWGSLGFFTGFLNSLAEGNPDRSYTPGFYLMVVLSAFLILNTHNIEMQMSSYKSIDQKPKNVYASKEFLYFEVCIFASGLLTAYTSCYMIWYIESLGGSQLLGGLALLMQSFLGEALFMYFSERLISMFGHWNVVTATFFVFAIRYYGYYLLSNPWFILPLEFLQGITYGLFYATMTSYAKQIAPDGSEATIQGVFGGTFQGLGTGLGSFVAGASIDAYGGKISFLFAAIFSTFAALISSIFAFVIKRSHPEIGELT